MSCEGITYLKISTTPPSLINTEEVNGTDSAKWHMDNIKYVKKSIYICKYTCTILIADLECLYIKKDIICQELLPSTVRLSFAIIM